MTDTDVTTLTRDDIAALRCADSVTFHLHQGRHYVRAHLDDTQRERIFTAREQRLFPVADYGRRREIPAHGDVMAYANDGGLGATWLQEPSTACFHMEHGARHDREWQTIASLLKPGSTPVLHWTADNNTTTVREAGLHIDQLALEVRREGREGQRFHVAWTCTPDNSARMIRRFG